MPRTWWRRTGPRRPVRSFLLSEPGNHVEAAEAPRKEPASRARRQLESPWKPCAAPPGAWPFHSASLAGFLSHPETHSPRRAGASPLPPTGPPFCPLRPALPPPPLPPPPLPPRHPPFGSLCQSAGRGELGQRRTQIFNSKQISPAQAESPFMHFFPLLS